MIHLLALGAAALFLGRLGLLLRLHLVDSPYHPVRHAVSDYAVGPTADLSRVATWVGAASWLVLAAATWTGLPGWDFRGTATLMLAAIGLIFLVLPLFPTDLEGAELTPRGIAHYAMAIGWFALSYSLTGDIARYAATHAQWGGYAPVLQGLHLVALVGLVAVCITLVPRLRRVFGLTERVFILAIALFYLVYAIGLATTA